MSAEDDERGRAELARALKNFAERLETPAYQELTVLQAKAARTRFDAFVAAGFAPAEALTLCTRTIDF